METHLHYLSLKLQPLLHHVSFHLRRWKSPIKCPQVLLGPAPSWPSFPSHPLHSLYQGDLNHVLLMVTYYTFASFLFQREWRATDSRRLVLSRCRFMCACVSEEEFCMLPAKTSHHTLCTINLRSCWMLACMSL